MIFHQKSNIRKVTLGQHVFYIRNLTSKNWCLANIFYTSGIQRRKTDFGAICYLHLKRNVGKLISDSVFFSLQNPASENWWQNNVFYSSEIWRWKTDVGQRVINLIHQKPNIGKPTSHMVFFIQIQHQKCDVGPTCLFHWKWNARKPMSSQRVFFIGNLMLENQCQANVFFSLGIWLLVNIFFSLERRRLKTDVWPTCFFWSGVWRQKTEVWPMRFLN